MVVTGAEPGAVYMACVTTFRRRRYRYVAAGHARGRNPVAVSTATRRYTGMFELCRQPAGGAMAIVTGAGGGHVATGHARRLAGAVALRTGARCHGAVIKPGPGPVVFIMALVAWLRGVDMVDRLGAGGALSRVAVTLVAARGCAAQDAVSMTIAAFDNGMRSEQREAGKQVVKITAGPVHLVPGLLFCFRLGLDCRQQDMFAAVGMPKGYRMTRIGRQCGGAKQHTAGYKPGDCETH